MNLIKTLLPCLISVLNHNEFVLCQIYGWKDGAVDPVADETRGYVLCRSCDDDCESPGYDAAS